MAPRPACCSRLTILFLASLTAFSDYALSASVSTSTPSPPLQWINLSNLLTGSKPPALKDASIGYDESSRTLIVFGGESQGGLPQASTYLLDLDTLTWSIPSPPQDLKVSPAARSAAISADDFAANFRRGHIVLGGKGNNGEPLSDVWEFDYNNQFWEQIMVPENTGPAVYGAVGGIDVTIPFNPVGQNTTLYLAGGISSSASSPSPLSETWQLDITGTLAPNVPRGVLASWIKHDIGTLPSVVGLGGTVILQKIIAYSGCTGTSSPSISCVNQNSYVIDTSTNQTVSPSGCVTPRLGPAVVPNRNTFSANFASQAFVILGLYDPSLWNDNDALHNGEVDIFDIGAGTWSRILPSGDPSKGTQSFPSPRQGAAALSHTSGLVGSSRGSYFDTIIFGGQDQAGAYLDDVWLLRAYNGSVSSSNQHWTGFGSGTLQAGVNADGQGVTMQFLSDCETPLATPSSSSSPSASSQPVSPSMKAPSGGFTGIHPFDTATTHKVFAPISIALALPAVILYRLGSPSASPPSAESLATKSISYATASASFAFGLAGFILSFTTISVPTASSLSKRAVSSSSFLKTTHGQAGLGLFVLFYGALPVLFLISTIRTRLGLDTSVANGPKTQNVTSHHHAGSASDAAEKLNGSRMPTDMSHAVGDRSEAATPAFESTPSPRKHQKLFSASSLMASFRSPAERRSSESIALSEPSGRSFEVVNRPRKRHLSVTGTATLSESSHRAAHSGVPRRSLSDVSWLERRRSVNAVSELDYVMSQLHHHPGPPTPGTTNMSTRALMNSDTLPDSGVSALPSIGQILLHLLMHTLIIALSVLSLVVLWQRGPKAAFGVFLAWVVLNYVLLFGLSWHGRPRDSALTVLLSKLRRGDAVKYTAAGASTPVPSRPLSAIGVDYSNSESRGPYLHSPAFRTAQEEEYYSQSHTGQYPSEEPESDEDEDTRQRRIEEEMQRREVSIVTVPKRRLLVVNPS